MTDAPVPPVDFSLPLSVEEAQILVRGLEAHLEAWREHYIADGGATHPPEDWEAVRLPAGHLLWRIEELARLPDQTSSHSPYAVRPPEGDDGGGGAGVREPRRPLPSSPATGETYKG